MTVPGEGPRLEGYSSCARDSEKRAGPLERKKDKIDRRKGVLEGAGRGGRRRGRGAGI